MSQNATESKKRGARRWLKLLLVASILVMPAFSTAAYADAPVGTNVWIGSKQGYGGTAIFPVYLQTPADASNPGEPDYWGYCIENRVDAETRIGGTVKDPADFLGSNLFTDPAVQGKVLWVLAHSYPALSLQEFGAAANVAGISRNDAIEATQYAIWRYTDVGFDSAWNWESSDSETAYWYLVDGANAAPGMTQSDFEATVSITGSPTVHTAGSLVGPFVVHTNLAAATVTADPAHALTDASGAAIDPSAVVDGQEVYLDLRQATAAGAATVSAQVPGSSASGRILSVPTVDGGTATAADHAQTLAIIAADQKVTVAQAQVSWAALMQPELSTSLVDAADGDQVLPSNGGTVIDRISYLHLTPGTEYTVVGELMRKSDGSSTGITGTATFTPLAHSGMVEVTFTIPAGFAGHYLVAFESLYESQVLRARHADIDDAAQTVLVRHAAAGAAAAPATGPHAALANTGSAFPMLGWGAGGLLLVIAGLGLWRGSRILR